MIPITFENAVISKLQRIIEIQGEQIEYIYNILIQVREGHLKLEDKFIKSERNLNADQNFTLWIWEKSRNVRIQLGRLTSEFIKHRKQCNQRLNHLEGKIDEITSQLSTLSLN